MECDIWCDGKCKTDDANYVNDGNNKKYIDNDGQVYICTKHHWACIECDKIVQIGQGNMEYECYDEHRKKFACEICHRYNAMKREDDIYICDVCNHVYPIKQEAV